MIAIPENLRFNWIPPSQRTKLQRLITGEFHEMIGTFASRGQQLVTLPERVLMHELEIKTTGALLPRIHQTSGSCVGAGGARAYTLAQVGDVFVRGDAEEIKIPFPYATYGVGREIAGSRGTGEGSFGGAQAKAIKQFGMLPWDDERVPKPVIKNGWASWRSNQEIQWSHPKAWPIQRSELEPDAQKFQITDVTQAESTDDVDQGLAQGFGVTIACMFGTKPRVEDDVLLGRWNDSWAHQQSITGYWLHPKHGKIYVIDNQWDDVHGHCPTLFPIGVTGSYWMLEKDLAKIIKSQDGEVYLHSNTEGFPLQQIDWGTMGICG